MGEEDGAGGTLPQFGAIDPAFDFVPEFGVCKQQVSERRVPGPVLEVDVAFAFAQLVVDQVTDIWLNGEEDVISRLSCFDGVCWKEPDEYLLFGASI